MPYIGNTPALDYISYAVQNFTVTAGTTVYTLDYSVSNENDIRLVINNVIQRPGASYAYSATGTTLTLTSATQSGDTMYAVFIGRAVQTVVPPANINIQLADGTAAAPSLNFANDTNTGIFRPTADTIAFTEGGTEAMRITSSGRVGIGQTNPATELQINATTPTIRLEENSAGSKRFELSIGSTNIAKLSANQSASEMAFETTGSERMRILSGGNVAIAATAIPDVGNNSNTGFGVQGSAGAGYTAIARDDNTALNVARQSTDGVIIGLWQGGTQEGNISVSGATVSYNGFTGSHWSRFIDDSKPNVLRGTVLESLDQMNDWYVLKFQISTIEKDQDGNDVVKTSTQKESYALKVGEKEGDVITYNFKGENYQATIAKEKDVKHVMSKISDTPEAKNVYGVFSAWDNDDLINNDFYVASVGSFVVRIKAGETVNKGDLLQSNGDGTAKVQADDIVRASSFAKVLSNTVIETYEDGSFIVPCSLMC